MYIYTYMCIHTYIHTYTHMHNPTNLTRRQVAGRLQECKIYVCAYIYTHIHTYVNQLYIQPNYLNGEAGRLQVRNR